MLLAGRKYHLRLWVVVTGQRPLRAYMHTRGLVLFSSQAYEPGEWLYTIMRCRLQLRSVLRAAAGLEPGR